MFFLINLIKKNLLLSVFVFIAVVLTIVLFFSDVFKKELLLTRTSPASQGVVVSLDSRTPILFYFSEPIDKTSIKVSIYPKTGFITQTVNTEKEGYIEVLPDPWWDFNKNYTITIDKSLRSANKSFLKEPIVFSFSLTPPTELNSDQPIGPEPPPHLKYQ
jgi:hypothetical protein